MLNRLAPVLFLITVSISVQAQYGGPRLFLDIPTIYFAAPDAPKINENLGAGIEAAFNMATHWGVARVGGGATYTFNPKDFDLESSNLTTPYFLVEAGVGKYRSNGNKCAKSHRPAFTALLKTGIRYEKYISKNRPDDALNSQFDYTVGVEFGYFYIRDIFKNYEVFARSNYHIQSNRISADIGFKMFLNLRAKRD